MYGRHVAEVLCKNKVVFQGFLVTDSVESNKKFYGKPVYSIGSMADVQNVGVVVAVAYVGARYEIEQNLHRKGVADIYLTMVKRKVIT